MLSIQCTRDLIMSDQYPIDQTISMTRRTWHRLVSLRHFDLTDEVMAREQDLMRSTRIADARIQDLKWMHSYVCLKRGIFLLRVSAGLFQAFLFTRYL